MEQPPAAAGIQLANWYWRVVRQFVSERFGISRCRSSCLNWLYRLGFACKRPKKRLLKANESKREAFVAEYAARWEEAQRTEASIFFADEAHFRADAELRGKWVLKGKPALVDSNSPRSGLDFAKFIGSNGGWEASTRGWRRRVSDCPSKTLMSKNFRLACAIALQFPATIGEKASYYSAVCLETGEVEWMELEGNSNSGTSVAFLTQLPDATEGKASRAAAGHLGQCAGPPWGSGAGVPQDA